MKILHLEDNPRDAALVHDVLTADWPDLVIKVVATRDDFLRELAGGGYDLVISDYQLPGFNGLEALQLVRERAPEVPLVFFSGTLGEESAIEAVRAGAADYVLKERMQRLPLSVQRVMREKAEHQARRQIEGALAQEQYLLRMLMDSVPDHVYFKDAESRFIAVNRALARRHGVEPAALVGRTDFDLFTPEHAQQAFEDEQHILRTGTPILGKEEKETWADGKVTWVSTSKLPLRDGSGRTIGTFGVSRDITELRQQAESLRLFRALVDRSNDVFEVIDPETARFLDVSEGGLRGSGLHPRGAPAAAALRCRSTARTGEVAGHDGGDPAERFRQPREPAPAQGRERVSRGGEHPLGQPGTRLPRRRGARHHGTEEDGGAAAAAKLGAGIDRQRHHHHRPGGIDPVGESGLHRAHRLLPRRGLGQRSQRVAQVGPACSGLL
jgi:PAS domain S-box-containing protein